MSADGNASNIKGNSVTVGDELIGIDLLQKWLESIKQELDTCVGFWSEHAIDHEYGGFYTCLTRNGQVYDDTKYGWMQGRHTWMFAKLYNEVPRYHTQEILNIAKNGAVFMYKYMQCPTHNRSYFAMTRDGKPTKIQRQIFTECFYVMAMAELYRATEKDRFKREVDKVVPRIMTCAREGSDISLGRPPLNGVRERSRLAVPMILLKVLMTMEDAGLTLDVHGEEMEEWGHWCITTILRHVQRDNTIVLENVSPEGEELSGCDGRLMNPGHVIECGWFCLEYGRRHGMSEEVRRLFLDTYIWRTFNTGWDQENGGLYYFLDSDGYCPMKLEWNFKLWWPICEAMIAMLTAYKEDNAAEDKMKYLQAFKKSHDFAIKHLKDAEHGEWFGYLNSQNEVQLSFKGSEWKGFYHVPNTLLMCEKLLTNILEKAEKRG